MVSNETIRTNKAIKNIRLDSHYFLNAFTYAHSLKVIMYINSVVQFWGSIYILHYLILPLEYISEGNIELSAPLHLFSTFCELCRIR